MHTTVVYSFVLLALVIFFIAILAVVLFSVFRIVKNSQGWVLWLFMFLGSGVLLLVMLATAFVGWVNVRPAEYTSAETIHTSAETIPKMPSPHFSQKGYSDTVEDTAADWAEDAIAEDLNMFIANTYPGIGQCGAPMANLVSDSIKEMLEEEPLAESLKEPLAEPLKEPLVEADPKHPKADPKVVIKCENDGLNQQEFADFLSEFRTEMKSLNRDWDCVKNGEASDSLSPNEGEPKQRSFVLTFKNIPSSVSSAKLICSVNEGDNVNTVGIQYEKKEWLTDLRKYSSSRGASYVVGQCESFEASSADARTKAIEDAKRQLEAMHPDVFTNQRGGIRNFAHKDSFLQKYTRPYGDVYRQSVLYQLDSSPITDKVRANEIVRPQNVWPTEATTGGSVNVGVNRTPASGVSRPTRSYRPPSVEWSIALLVGMTLVLGMLSNVFTKGYYRSEISATMIGLLVVGLSVLIFILMA